jgi:hypothetical protein
MVRTISAFMEFCYLVRRSQIDEDTLDAIDAAVDRFHRERLIFIELGIREDFSLPRQHSLVHYRPLIELYGAPYGVSSDATETKHKTAVKEPWRRSSRNQPLGQMLLTNQRLDKLAASRIDFQTRGMLGSPIVQALPQELPPQVDDGDEDDAGDAPGMTSLGDVKLARIPGTDALNHLLKRLF